MNTTFPVIGLVGPCAAGKSTLREALRTLGYPVKHIAQEHSFVQNMWQRIAKPDILIFLDVSYEISQERRPMGWSAEEYAEEQKRLVHAREHANLYISTDNLTAEEVLAQVLDFITAKT